ncbi:MAG: RagB/SusD family nutrient uptake outer membrane protein [Chitinophagaceae bacterium]
MKKLVLYLSASIVFLLPSCNKMLDEDIRSQAVYDYLETPSGFEDATKAAYASLKTFYGQERGYTLSVFGTDTYTMGADGAFKFVNQYTPELDGRLSIIREIWNEFYVAVNTCNTVIDMAPTLVGVTDKVKNIRIAEARFLRAHYFFILTQMFGPIPIPMVANKKVITEATREPLDKVYAAIIADLEFGAANLEVKPVDYGRATKPAAEHLLARVYLTKAGSDAKKPDDYAKALDYAKKVINNYGFKLLPDFGRVFEQGIGEKNDEVIWSVQNTNDPRTNGEGNRGHLYFIMEYDVLPGMQRDTENGRPFKRFRPTNFTLNVLFNDRLNDTRYEKSFKHVFYSNNAATIPKVNGVPRYNVGDTSVWLPGTELPATVINSKPYAVYPPSKYSPKIFPTLIKFLDPLRPDRTYEQGSRDFLVYRLAETHLIAAEAAMFTGDNASASNFINAVRLRAARTSTNAIQNAEFRTAMIATPAMMNIDFILDERGRELLGEQIRWFDLVRTGKLIERVKKWNPDAAAIKDHHILRPIPQEQIDRTTGTFKQNPGY